MPDPGQYANVVLYRGCQFSDSFTVEDDAGAAVEIASATANIYSGSPDSPGEMVLEVSTDNDLLVAAANVVTRTIGSALTEDLVAGDYWYELLIWPDGADDPLEPVLGYLTVYPTGLVDGDA